MNEQIREARETVQKILQQNGIKRAAFYSIWQALKLDLEDALERRVDLLTYRSLHPMLKDRILAKQVPIL
jgi:hypothetical protein